MSAKSLAGTRAAYVSCGSCGHARIRHSAGNGCGAVRLIRTTVSDDPAATAATLHRCTCTHFTEPKGAH